MIFDGPAVLPEIFSDFRRAWSTGGGQKKSQQIFHPTLSWEEIEKALIKARPLYGRRKFRRMHRKYKRLKHRRVKEVSIKNELSINAVAIQHYENDDYQKFCQRHRLESSIWRDNFDDSFLDVQTALSCLDILTVRVPLRAGLASKDRQKWLDAIEKEFSQFRKQTKP